MRPWPALAFVLLLAVVTTAEGQARLGRPGRSVPPPRTGASVPADSLAEEPDLEPLSRAERERELDRLRRRTGTAVAPAPAERPPRAQPLFAGDGGFEVAIETDAPEYFVGETEEETEPLFIRLTSAADGYLTLLSGGTGRDFVILAPNDLIASFPVRAGEPVTFPLPQWVQQGIELRPQLPDDTDLSQQTLIAVVTRRPIPLPLVDFNLTDPRDTDRRIAIRTFQNWFTRLPIRERGIGQAFYLVRRR